MHFKHYYLTESKVDKAIEIISQSDSRFVHISKNPINELEVSRVENRNNNSIKPAGLWGGVGTEWIKWVVNEMPEWFGDHIYTFDVKNIKEFNKSFWGYDHLYKDSVIQIKPDDVLDFSKLYSNIFSQKGVKRSELEKRYQRALDKGDFGPIKINWSKVSNICDGVLFDPYNSHLSRVNIETSWYMGIDVPSVCVFDPKCIDNWNKIEIG